MGKVLSVIIGLVLMALGIWGVIKWPADVLVFVRAAVVIMAVLIGLGIFVFGVSELRAGDEQPTVEAPAPQPPPEAPGPTG
jgi:hypothetical protein